MEENKQKADPEGIGAENKESGQRTNSIFSRADPEITVALMADVEYDGLREHMASQLKIMIYAFAIENNITALDISFRSEKTQTEPSENARHRQQEAIKRLYEPKLPHGEQYRRGKDRTQE